MKKIMASPLRKRAQIGNWGIKPLFSWYETKVQRGYEKSNLLSGNITLNLFKMPTPPF
ncbi:MAG: hypothetical protein IT270_09030 [Saprospiraceae bacterium]|nr:hypothetical protein [Saprospiraceae bacterium]